MVFGIEEGSVNETELLGVVVLLSWLYGSEGWGGGVSCVP